MKKKHYIMYIGLLKDIIMLLSYSRGDKQMEEINSMLGGVADCKVKDKERRN